MTKTRTKGKIIVEGVADFSEDYYHWGKVDGEELYSLLEELFGDYDIHWAGNARVRLTLEVLSTTEDITRMSI